MILRIIYVFEPCLKWWKCIYMLNASNKLWVNENNIVEELPYPDMTCLGNQYKFDSAVWLTNA